MKEYIIGHYVKCTKAYEWVKVGDILRITNLSDIHTFSVHVEAEDGRSSLLNTHLHSDPECEYYGPTKELVKTEEKGGFSIGDWCYIINKGSSGLKAGEVYQINEISFNYHFDFDGTNKKNNACWLTRTDFRKATEEEIASLKKTDVSTTKEPITIEKYIPKEGEYAVMLQEYGGAKIGEIVKVVSQQSDLECSYVQSLKGSSYGAPWWYMMRKARIEEIPGNNISSVESVVPTPPEHPLIIEARRRYPIGTVYIPTHIADSGEKCNVYSHDFKYNASIADIRLGNGNYTKNGHGYSEVLYQRGRWAEIVSKPAFDTERIEEQMETLKEKDDMQELLEEAKRRYKEGDVIYSAYMPQNKYKSTITSLIVNGRNINNGTSCAVYYNGKWAEIVSKRGEKGNEDIFNSLPTKTLNEVANEQLVEEMTNWKWNIPPIDDVEKMPPAITINRKITKKRNLL